MNRNLKILLVLACISVITSTVVVSLFDVVNTLNRDMFEVIIGASVVLFVAGIILCINMFDLTEGRRTYGNRG